MSTECPHCKHQFAVNILEMNFDLPALVVCPKCGNSFYMDAIYSAGSNSEPMRLIKKGGKQ